MRPFLWILAALPLTSPLAGGCAVQTGMESFSIDGQVHRIDIETDGGDVRVVAGNETLVTAELSWQGDRPGVRADFSGGVLRVVSPCLERDDTCEVTLTLVVPPGVSGTVRSRGGDIFIEDTFSAVEAASVQGEVRRL